MGVGTVRSSLSVLDRAAVTGAVVLVVAMTVDLGLVAYNNTHNGDFTHRVVMSLVAIAFTCVAAVVARQRGIGRLWGAWIGVGLLVGGVLANGLSQFIWSRGTPDFIHFYSLSPNVWNIADFEIWWGLTGGLVSIAIAALIAFARERLSGGSTPPVSET
jgi:lipoprotein signal peptidase